MGFYNTLKTSRAISDLFETHKSLTCAQIEEYCLEHKCYPEYSSTAKGEDILRHLIDFSISFLRGDLHHEFTEMAIEPFDMTAEQEAALKEFMITTDPDYNLVYQIKFRKTEAWKNERLPTFSGYDT